MLLMLLLESCWHSCVCCTQEVVASLTAICPALRLFRLKEIMGLLKRDPVVSYVVDTKTEEIGPRIFRFKVC